MAEEQLWGLRRRLGHRLGLGFWVKEGVCSVASGGECMERGASPEQHTVLCSTGSGFPLVLQGIWMRLPGERISLRSHSLAVFVP